MNALFLCGSIIGRLRIIRNLVRRIRSLRVRGGCPECEKMYSLVVVV